MNQKISKAVDLAVALARRLGDKAPESPTDKLLPLQVSVSGGRTSMYMAAKLKRKWQGLRELIFIFANTSKEDDRTLDFIEQCDQHFGLGIVWVEAVVNQKHGKGVGYRVVNHATAARDGSVFEAVMAKHGLPNQTFQSCTREMKARTIRAYMRDRLGKKAKYETAIGIRSDETFRINWVSAALSRTIYPLATEWPVTSLQIRKFWAAMPFDLQLKDYEGNCDLCWKKSKRKKATILLERPEVADWWVEMEEKYSGLLKKEEVARGVTAARTMHRDYETTLDLLDYAKSGEFKRAVDLYEKHLKEVGYTMFDSELDAETACFCGVD